MSIAQIVTQPGAESRKFNQSQVADSALAVKLERVPLRARTAFRVLDKIVRGSLSVTLPDGRTFVFQGNEPGTDGQVRLKSYRVFGRLIRSGTLGFGEGYMAGEWDSPDVTALLEVAIQNAPHFERFFRSGRLMRPLQKLFLKKTENTKSGSKRNIMAHYDLGNDFYGHWLDSSMTYSSARFLTGEESLKEAQTEKYRMLADALDLQPHHKVLEIGCGWGGFAEYAASEIGCEITGITLSREQHTYATERMNRLGLSSKASFRLQDYRDVDETFDRIVSIEMLEAVGAKYWPIYFQTLKGRLNPGGKAGIQVITIRDEAFEFYSSRADFIQRYIFPGGMLPSPAKLTEHVEASGLTWIQDFAFGRDYARTLKLWRDSFEANWPAIRNLGFDERFKTLWHYYLCYCEAGFKEGNIDVLQFTVENSQEAQTTDPNPGVHRTKDHTVRPLQP